jgi:hypothetical protein
VEESVFFEVSPLDSAAVVVSAGAAVVEVPGLEEPHALNEAVIKTAIANANALFFIMLFPPVINCFSEITIMYHIFVP